MVLWLQDIQLLFWTPQKLSNHFKLQPGTESRTATFLWHRAHHPAHCPAPGHLHRLSAAPKQCQNITWELRSFNNRTGGNRTTTASGWFFLPQGKRWQVGIMGMGRRTFCSWHSNNHLWSASPLQRDRPTYIRRVLLQLLSLKGSWKLAEHHTASSCSKHNSDLCEESDTEINTKVIYWDI